MRRLLWLVLCGGLALTLVLGATASSSSAHRYKPIAMRSEVEGFTPTRAMPAVVSDGKEMYSAQEYGKAVLYAMALEAAQTPPKPKAIKRAPRPIQSAPVAPEAVEAPPAPQEETPASDSGVWDRIAACESGGNWATNTGNGYYGGLQMDMAFWHSYGGDEFASRPDLASRSQQIIVAERARDSGRGYGPWPVCGRRA